MENKELNKRLAELIGWTDIEDADKLMMGVKPANGEKRGYGLVPNWCDHWSEIGPLAAEYEIDVIYINDGVCGVWGRERRSWEPYQVGWQDMSLDEMREVRSKATRMALVRAIIAKLDHMK